MAVVQNPPPTPTVSLGVDSAAFSDPAPGSWADLDLSGIVGSNNALVLLRIGNASAGGTSYRFRVDGIGDDVAYTGVTGLQSAYMGAGKMAFLWVSCSAAGIVEWSNSDTASTSVYVFDFVKAAS